MMRLVLVTVLILCTACAVRHRVVTNGASIHRELETLRARGEADIEAEDRSEDERKRVEVRLRMRETVTIAGKEVPVEELAKECPLVPRFDVDGNPLEWCGLIERRYHEIELDTYDERSVSAFLVGITVTSSVVGFLGMTGCALACEPGTERRHVSIAGSVILGAGLLVAMFASCAGRWGEPGCRD